MKRANDHGAEDISQTMATNFESPYHLCQLAHPLLKASGDGCIVFISSIAGVVALPALSVYAASKGKIFFEKWNYTVIPELNVLEISQGNALFV